MGLYGENNQISYEILNKLRSNMILLKFLYYVDECERDIATLPDLDAVQVKNVTDNYIYRYQKVDGSKDTDKRCYISMCYGDKIYHSKNNYMFFDGTFKICILCDRDIDYILQNGSRVNAIEKCISDTLEGCTLSSFGDIFLRSSVACMVNGTNYIGREIILDFYDKSKQKVVR